MGLFVRRLRSIIFLRVCVWVSYGGRVQRKGEQPAFCLASRGIISDWQGSSAEALQPQHSLFIYRNKTIQTRIDLKAVFWGLAKC